MPNLCILLLTAHCAIWVTGYWWCAVACLVEFAILFFCSISWSSYWQDWILWLTFSSSLTTIIEEDLTVQRRCFYPLQLAVCRNDWFSAMLPHLSVFWSRGRTGERRFFSFRFFLLLRQRMIGISLPYCSEVFGWLSLVQPSLAELVTPSHGCTPVLGTLLAHTGSIKQTSKRSRLGI